MNLRSGGDPQRRTQRRKVRRRRIQRLTNIKELAKKNPAKETEKETQRGMRKTRRDWHLTSQERREI